MANEKVVIKGRTTGKERIISREMYNSLLAKGLLKVDVLRVVPVEPENLKVEKASRTKANTSPDANSNDSAGEA